MTYESGFDPFPGDTLFEEIGRHTLNGHSRRGYLFSSRDSLRLFDRPDAEARVARFGLPDLILADVLSTGHEVDVVEVSHTTLLLPLHGVLNTVTASAETRLDPGDIAIFPPNQRRTRVEQRADRPYWALVLLFAPSLLTQALRREGVPADKARRLAAVEHRRDPVRSPPALELAHLLLSLRGEVIRGAGPLGSGVQREAWRTLVMSKIVEMLLQDSEWPSVSVGVGIAEAHVIRALDYINAHYATISTVVEIAETVGVSTRTLEQSFARVMGIGPRRALSDIRLDAAYRGVMSGDAASVTDVALSCGITHFGRFAGQFRAKYGKSPSEVLRSSRHM